MNQQDTERQVFIVGIDGSDPSRRAVEFAIDLARRYEHPRLLVVTVVDWPAGMLFPEAAPVVPALDSEWFERAEQDMLASARRQILDPAMQTIEGSGVEVESEVAFGSPAHEIVELASSHQATGIIVGRSGHKGLRRPIFGGVASSVLQGAGCPVFVVP